MPWRSAAVAAAVAGAAGAAPVGDWRADAPGAVHRITVADLPKVFATPPAGAPAAVVSQPAGARPSTLPGYSVGAFAKLDGPRQIRVSPGGDIFVAETDQGRIRVLRAADGARTAAGVSTFAEGLDRPFGIAFYPSGDPRWVYVATANSVARYPYRAGDLKARAPAQTIVARLAATTRG
nr:sorbosone dehydrogenase family protein [Caulobacteraceae bacterium]